jgi:hypothetical protein
MKLKNWFATLTVSICAIWSSAHATDRNYSDIATTSPSKQYRIEAKSPDNANKEKRKAFQRSFVYTATDSTTNQVLWTRMQAEGSPVHIYVSDEGWTVIRTAYDELFAVDFEGHSYATVDIMDDGLTAEERAKYVQYSTAGPMWAGHSHWYFLELGDQTLFVVRPWWGRRIIVDIQAGEIIDETKVIADEATATEREYVIAELTKGVASKELNHNAIYALQKAAFLASQLQVTETIPMLEQLQKISYFGSSRVDMSLLIQMKKDEDNVTNNPDVGKVTSYSYSTNELRQVIHLALRRLGKKPKPLPVTLFSVNYRDYQKNHAYVPTDRSVPREENATVEMIDMSPQQVLDLIGSPDFVVWRAWEYDMDADEPFTLIVSWKENKVIQVERKTSARWQNGLVRDGHIID